MDMSRQVDKKSLELLTLLDNVLKTIDIKQVDFALECKINPGTLSKALERKSFSEDIVDKIHDRYGVRKAYWEDGKEPIFEKNGTYVELPKGSAENEEVYRNIVEGNTEYILIPRSVLQEKYRLVALEQFEKDKEQMDKDKKIIDRLLSINEKLMNAMASLEPKATEVQKAQ